MRPRSAHTNGVTENSASPTRRHSIITPRAIPSPPTSALIVAERRHSAVTRYAERSRACRDSTHPLLTACRRYATTASIPTQHQRRAYGASETRYCIITPFARRGSGGRMGHRRSTITRRVGDALLLQSRSMTARAVTSSVNPRQRRGQQHAADAPRTRRR